MYYFILRTNMGLSIFIGFPFYRSLFEFRFVANVRSEVSCHRRAHTLFRRNKRPESNEVPNTCWLVFWRSESWGLEEPSCGRDKKATSGCFIIRAVFVYNVWMHNANWRAPLPFVWLPPPPPTFFNESLSISDAPLS